MNSIAKKNTYGRKLRKQSAKQSKYLSKQKYINKNLYDWAESLFYENKLTATLLHTLKAIIATRLLPSPTLKQINDARTRSCARKFAQAPTISQRTMIRHIEKLEALKLINVIRTKDAWYARNTYFINAPEDKLVIAPRDTVSLPISCSSSLPGEERGAIHSELRASRTSHFKKRSTADRAGAIAPPSALATEDRVIEFKPKTEEQKALGRLHSEQIKQMLKGRKKHGY